MRAVTKRDVTVDNIAGSGLPTEDAMSDCTAFTVSLLSLVLSSLRSSCFNRIAGSLYAYMTSCCIRFDPV